jgi:hypothetical protein
VPPVFGPSLGGFRFIEPFDPNYLTVGQYKSAGLPIRNLSVHVVGDDAVIPSIAVIPPIMSEIGQQPFRSLDGTDTAATPERANDGPPHLNSCHQIAHELLASPEARNPATVGVQARIG